MLLHMNGKLLCSSFRRLVPLFVGVRLHTGASQEKRKEASPIKDPEVFTTGGTYPWSFVTQIFHTGKPSHDSDRKTFDRSDDFNPAKRNIWCSETAYPSESPDFW
jgi:hypothetical protein